MVGVGVVGFGYWGPNLVRNFGETAGAKVVAICDRDQKAQATAAARYPAAKVTGEFRDLLSDSRVDAVIIATPVETHFELASAALAAGKHVLVEKPMTATREHAERLIEQANKHNKILMVDHTFVYTGAVRKMKQLVLEGAIGDLLYYDSVRINLGLFQRDVNVIWDLAPHDASIVEHLVTEEPIAVQAVGVAHVPGQPENIAYLTMLYQSKFIAHLHVNWLAPVKVRQTLLGGSKRMIIYDDMQSSEKVKVYDRGVEIETSPDRVYQLRVGYRSGDMYSPKIEVSEALRAEAAHFVDCIERSRKPLTDGEAGLRVVTILEAAARSMASGGQMVKLR